ncbi:hypothetical protein LO80_03270 [Candidatus Francisella endociliophora]|uniref:Scaffolding protein n=1 Tax=Candidatus Francisella endociliophora TaxID=653937 RepID=A0A097ENE7_9GAMM|nr:hypothetical protein [Francisella sp. FSC1006]AIT09088.1 hypothetical protein LO80_03270 [Francisella sp. FSC1006]
MSEQDIQNQETDAQDVQSQDVSNDDLAQRLKQLEEQNKQLQEKYSSVVSVNEQLLSEKQKAEEQARLEAEEKARKNGDWEAILKAKEQELEAYKEKDALRVQQEKNFAKEKLIGSISSVFTNPVLTRLVEPDFTYSEDLGKPIFKHNGVAYDNAEKIKEVISLDPQFKDFVKATGATGGHASGGINRTPIDNGVSGKKYDDNKGKQAILNKFQ